jgi:hypothetical protein
MLLIERDTTNGEIVAIRQGQMKPGLEAASLFDEEVLAFFRSSGELELFSQLLELSDTSIIRVLEDLIDLLIEKKLILFTELPKEAQEKIQSRKRLRTKMGSDDLMVDDIL